MRQALQWKNTVSGHRAYFLDGAYFIDRYKDPQGRAYWSMDYVKFNVDDDDESRVTPVAWAMPEFSMKHTLDHAKMSCQRHCNDTAGE